MKDRPRALSVLVAVFLAGIIIGAAGSFFWFKPPVRVERSYNAKRPPLPSDMQERPTFAQILELTPEQDAQFSEITKKTRKQIMSLEIEQRAELNKKIENVWVETNSKLRTILNEEQQVKFDDFLDKMRDWRDRTQRRIGPESPRENRMGPESPRENHRKPEIPMENRKRPPEQL